MSTNNATQQTVSHGAAGRAGSEINVVRRGPVNGNVSEQDCCGGVEMRRQNVLVLVICTTALGLAAVGIVGVTRYPKTPRRTEPVVVSLEPPGVMVQGRRCVFLEERYANGRLAWRTSVLRTGGSSYSMGGPEAELYDRHGSFTAYYENGRMREHGAYFKGKKHGRWRYWAADGELQKEEVYQMGVPRKAR